MKVIEVDVIDSQPRQRLVEGLMDILWATLHDSVCFSMAKSELGGEEDFVALSGLLKPVLPSRGQDCKRGESLRRMYAYHFASRSSLSP